MLKVNREYLFGEIKALLESFVTAIEGSNRLNLTDKATYAEDVFARILNEVFGFTLINANAETVNADSVDLVDSKKKVAFQVTSNQSLSSKKAKTLTSFLGNPAYRKYRALYILYLTNKKASNKVLNVESINDHQTIEGYDLAKLLRIIKVLTPRKMQSLLLVLEEELVPFEHTCSGENSKLIELYCEGIKGVHESLTKDFIAIPCWINGKETDSNSLLEALNTYGRLHIYGPSGCGKTQLCRGAVIETINSGRIPIFIEAKYFDGDVNSLTPVEAQGGQPFGLFQFLNIVRALHKKIVLIVDGFNECPPNKQERLAEIIGTTQRRYSCDVVVVSQVSHPCLDPINLTRVVVELPSIQIKRAIALLASGKEIIAEYECILENIQSCLEAKIVGEISGTSRFISSKFQLLIFFIQRKLGSRQTKCVSILAAIANRLNSKTAFSLDISDFNRILENLTSSEENTSILFEQGILRQHYSKMSFGHEMYLQVCTVEAIIRECNDDATRLSKVFKLPKNRDKSELILGAITDSVTLEALLSEVNSSALVIKLASGQGGQYCLDWTNRKFEEILERMETEISGLTYVIDEKALRGFSSTQSIVTWNSLDQAIIGALPELLSKGRFIDEIMALVKLVDAGLKDAFSYLSEEARNKEISLRSGLFSCAYSQMGTQGAAISTVIDNIASCSIDLKLEVDASKFIKWINEPLISNGQLYLMLILLKFRHIEELTGIVLQKLASKLRNLPYHLKLELIQYAGWQWQYDDRRLELINELHELGDQGMMLNGAIVDSLSQLGAFEDDERDYQSQVDDELNNVLAEDDEPSWQHATVIYNSQFDHPYSSAFCEAINALSPDQRTRFLARALKGMGEGLFLTSLIIEYVNSSDLIDPTLFNRWCQIPSVESHHTQEATAAFFLCHITLAKHGIPIISKVGTFDTDFENSLIAIAELLYWVNRREAPPEMVATATRPLLDFLCKEDNYCALESIRLSWEGLSYYSIKNCKFYPFISFTTAFPSEAVSIARKALKNEDFQKVYFQFDRSIDTVNFGITVLGQFGSVSDLPSLRRYVDSERTCSMALGAIRMLETS